MKKLILAITLLTTSLNLHAQGGASPTAGMSASFVKLFGANNNFTATVDLAITPRNQSSAIAMPMNFSLLADRMRADIDMTQIKSASIPPAALAQMKQMGMDRVVNITRIDQKSIYIIYPGMKSYAKMPLPAEDTAALGKDLKIDTTKIGEETIDGHPCTKNKVTFTVSTNQPQTFTVWNATDLKDFPVQIQTTEKNGTLLMHYHDLKFTKPAVTLFDPPAGFTAYADIQQMMMSAMQKMMGGMGRPPQ